MKMNTLQLLHSDLQSDIMLAAELIYLPTSAFTNRCITAINYRLIVPLF